MNQTESKPYKIKIFISESFLCPSGFFKCPESFCLEDRFVCDGEKHCKTGEDEQNCGRCTTNYITYVSFHKALLSLQSELKV